MLQPSVFTKAVRISAPSLIRVLRTFLQVLKFNVTLFSYIGPNLVILQECITCADMNRNYTHAYEGICLNVYDVKFKSTELP